MDKNKRADFELLQEIGAGATSVVYRAKIKSTGAECAVKVFKLSDLPEAAEDRILKEISTLSLLSHPNVIKLVGSFVTRGADGKEELWMVTPLIAHGSVLDVMRDVSPLGLQEDCIAVILSGVLEALNYLHSNSSLHRDVKAGNIFVASDGAVILGDFGVAAELIENGEANSGRRTFAGTPCWMAPEVMQQSSYSTAADIWSFGITAIELAKGRVPHSEFAAMKVVMKVMSSEPPSLDEGEDKKRFSAKFRAMVKRCLCKEPEGRPTAAQLLKDPFFKKVKDSEYLKQTILARLPPIWERRKSATRVEAKAEAKGEEPKKETEKANTPAVSVDESAAAPPLSKFGSLMSLVDSSTKINKK